MTALVVPVLGPAGPGVADDGYTSWTAENQQHTSVAPAGAYQLDPSNATFSMWHYSADHVVLYAQQGNRQ